MGDLDRAVELFCDVLDLPLLRREPATIVTGELAVVDLGGLLLTLLCPAADGDGNLLADRTPRLSQLVLSVDGADADQRHAVLHGLLRTAAEHGLATQQSAVGYGYLTPEAVEGAVGQPIAIVAMAGGSAAGETPA